MVGENINKVTHIKIIVFFHTLRYTSPCRLSYTEDTCSHRVTNNWVSLFREQTESKGAATDGFSLFPKRYSTSRTVLDFGGYENFLEIFLKQKPTKNVLSHVLRVYITESRKRSSNDSNGSGRMAAVL